MIEDVFERHVAGRRPVPHRAAVAARLRARVHRPPGPLARRRPQRHRDGAAGTSSARRSTSRSTSCSAAGCTSGCAPTRTSTPRTTTEADVYHDPELAAERAAEYVGRASPRSSSTRPAPTRPSIHASPRSRRSTAARRSSAPPRGRRHRPTCCSAPTASSRRPAPIRLASRLEPFDPLWFEEPMPPEMPEEMARWRRRRRSRSPPASG